MIKIVIADDHDLLAESLKFVLGQDEDIEVVGIASNGLEAIELCKRLLPDVILLDIKMPGYDGIEAASVIRRECCGVRIVILTTFEDGKNIFNSVKTGVDGYILKDVKPDKLILAVKCIYSGFCVMDSTAWELIVKKLAYTDVKGTATADGRFKPEDIDIIRLIGDGKSYREIGEVLNYSEGSIKNRVSRILEELELKDRTQLVIYALKNDLI